MDVPNVRLEMCTKERGYSNQIRQEMENSGVGAVETQGVGREVGVRHRIQPQGLSITIATRKGNLWQFHTDTNLLGLAADGLRCVGAMF